jgi:hypothetical protein
VLLSEFLLLFGGVQTLFPSGWAETARMIQGLLLLDLNHDIHNIHDMLRDNDQHAIYLGLSAVGFACAVIDLVFLFMDFTGCSLGMFFTVLTLVMAYYCSSPEIRYLENMAIKKQKDPLRNNNQPHGGVISCSASSIAP